MRKIILLSAIMIATNLFGQKQEQENVTLELEFAPLGASPLKISSLRGRYFIDDIQAFRLSLYMGGKYTPTKEEIEEEGLYFKRYFYQKRIKPITSITEISKDDYFSAKNLQDNKNRLIFAEIYWKVRGDKVQVAQLNRNEVLSAETTFPGLKRFIVNYNEFYINDGY